MKFRGYTYNNYYNSKSFMWIYLNFLDKKIIHIISSGAGYSSRQELDRKLGLNMNIQSKVLAHYAEEKNVSGNILAKSYPLSSATGGELITLYTTAYFQLP